MLALHALQHPAFFVRRGLEVGFPSVAPTERLLYGTLEAVKERLRTAHRAATKADYLSVALFDQWMAEALTLSKGQSVDRAAAMLLRTAAMLEIAAECRGWPKRVSGLPGAQAKRQATAAIEKGAHRVGLPI
jgi:hypothetical protein